MKILIFEGQDNLGFGEDVTVRLVWLQVQIHLEGVNHSVPGVNIQIVCSNSQKSDIYESFLKLKEGVHMLWS